MWKRSGLVLVLAIVTAAALLAHDLFLKLETYFVPPETTVRVAVLNGSFASSEGSVTPDRLLDGVDYESKWATLTFEVR